MNRSRLTAALSALALLCIAAPAGAAMPIPGPLDGPLPLFSGTAVAAQPLKGPWLAHNPALAPDGRSGSGMAAGNGGATPLPGPLGRGTKRSSGVQSPFCSSLAFDARGRLLAVCAAPLSPVLLLIDPRTLDTIASLSLPPRFGAPDLNDAAGGPHFMVRSDGSLIVPTNSRTLMHVAVSEKGLQTVATIDLGSVMSASERPYAVAAGYDGLDWVAGTKGTIATVGRDGRVLKALPLKEPLAEDLATDARGTYAVTRDALYRLRADADGTPQIVWRMPVPVGITSDTHAGRYHQGSGTPPALIPGGYVAVADGLNPPRLLVARTAGPDSRRLACAVPLFKPGVGSVEAQLVVAGHSVVASNAYGYDGFATTEGGRTTVGGITRVIVGRRGCRTGWESSEVSPSAQAVVSRATGLLYTVVKPKHFPDEWNLEAIDWRTGKVRFAALAGEGLGFNNSGGAVALGPDGAAYAASFGGISRWADSR